jgi:hypothetical protein
VSVYATAGDVVRFLGTDEGRAQVAQRLAPLGVSRLFLEGRRGDEYAGPAVLREARDFFAARQIRCSGAIATVPGGTFGTRQTGGLGWLNWESPRTRRDVAGFFGENAPVFGELIVDDFFCTGDVSAESEQALGGRSWSEYRRDLLVSLIDPLMVEPTRAANPATRLILKFPQWYDRFHLFGYDPPRMARPFDEVWVGTEVRNPQTRRMGYVQPTQGYVSFRWVRSVVDAILSPAFVRRRRDALAAFVGVEVGGEASPATATEIRWSGGEARLPEGIDLDAALRVTTRVRGWWRPRVGTPYPC